MTNTNIADLLPIYLRSLALTVLAVGPAFGLMVYYGWSARTPLACVLAAVVVGVVAWLTGLKLLHHPIFAEITRTFGKIRSKARRS